MPIEFRCADCATVYEVGGELVGKPIRCRECNGLNRVPSPVKKPDPLPVRRPHLSLRNDGASSPAKKPDALPARKSDSEQPPSSHVAIRYRCPYCNSDKPPIWRNYWTPTSTLVFYLVLAPFLSVVLLSALAVLLTPLIAEEVNAKQKGLGNAIVVVGLMFFLGVLIAFRVLSGSHLVKEARQVCPDCDVRIS